MLMSAFVELPVFVMRLLGVGNFGCWCLTGEAPTTGYGPTFLELSRLFPSSADEASFKTTMHVNLFLMFMAYSYSCLRCVINSCSQYLCFRAISRAHCSRRRTGAHARGPKVCILFCPWPPPK